MRRLLISVALVGPVALITTAWLLHHRKPAAPPPPPPPNEYSLVVGDFGDLDSIAMTTEHATVDDLPERDVPLVFATLAHIEITARRGDNNSDPESGGHSQFGGVLHFDHVEVLRGGPRETVEMPFKCLAGSFRTKPEFAGGIYPCPYDGESYFLTFRKGGGHDVSSITIASESELPEMREVAALTEAPPDGATAQLTVALVSGKYLARPAAIRMIARRDFPPDVTFAAVSAAIGARHPPTDAGEHEEEFYRVSFADAAWQGRPPNAGPAQLSRLLGLYARGLCSAPATERWTWIAPMDSAVHDRLSTDPLEDAARRAAVLGGITTPPRADVIAAIEAPVADANAAWHVGPLLDALRSIDGAAAPHWDAGAGLNK